MEVSTGAGAKEVFLLSLLLSIEKQRIFCQRLSRRVGSLVGIYRTHMSASRLFVRGRYFETTSIRKLLQNLDDGNLDLLIVGVLNNKDSSTSLGRTSIQPLEELE